jgi:hypothetical protein
MIVLKPFLSRLSDILPAPLLPRLSRYRRKPFVGARMLAILLLSGGALIIGVAAGAQGLWSSGEATATKFTGPDLGNSEIEGSRKRHLNLDIRVNAQGNIARVIEANRIAGGMDIPEISKKALEQVNTIDRGLKTLKLRVPDAEAKLSPLTSALELLRSPGTLSGPAPGQSGEAIVRGFVRDNKDLYGLSNRQIDGLNFLGESISGRSGLRMVRAEQMLNGYPIFQSETRFLLDREGRMVRSVGSMIHRASAPPAALNGLMPPQEALRSAMASLDVEIDAGRAEAVQKKGNGSGIEIRANDPNVKGIVTSRLVYFPVAPGVLVPAWSQIIFGVDADWYVLTDAREGTVLWRKNIRSDASTHEARFRVYVQADGKTPADSPAPSSPGSALPGGGTQFGEILPSIVSMSTAQDILASPNGWIDDCPGGVCTAAQTQTQGNNTIVCMDRDLFTGIDFCDTSGASGLDGDGMPMGNPDIAGRSRDFLGTSPRDFMTNYTPPPQGGPTGAEIGVAASGNGSSGTLPIDEFRRGAVTHLFYMTNWYHDRLFDLGFDPASGNFQTDNFGGGGLGSDRVLGDAQDNSGADNATFSTPPDGTSGRMQMFLFLGPTVDRDGGLDAEIVLHELTHGTSNRLIGNAAGLAWHPGVGMGEGWSDFFALSLLNNAVTDTPAGKYALGAYATYKFGGAPFLDNYVYGIRRFPYSTDNTVNPMTWADVDENTTDYSGGIAISPRGVEVAGAMEVHNIGEVWALTLWEVRGRIIAASGDVPTGNETTLQLVTDGMKMTPLNPSFTEARDAILDADCATNGCDNEESIWGGFADRGLGFKASAPLGYQFAWISPHMGILESFDSPNLDIDDVSITDTIGNSSGFIDPNESVRVFVDLKNGWRDSSKDVASASATLTSSTPGVSILAGSATYPAIAAQGTATGDYFVIKAPAAAPCGSSMKFTISITSTLGVVSRDFTLRIGAPSGTGLILTYTKSAVGLAIPNAAPRGVFDGMTITDDFEIADLNFRVDSILHTATGDVTVGLKGPTGYGTDLISATGGLVGGGGTGDHFTSTVIDDSAPAELTTAPNSAAPFTGSWKPICNNPSLSTVDLPADPVGQLSRFNGTSTAGIWIVRVSDQAQFANATGTLAGWSLIVTPRAFTCTPFVPTAAAVSVSGRVLNEYGYGVSKAIVTLSGSTGATRTVLTNAFGYYRFDNLTAGNTYFLNAASKRYRFSPRVISIGEDLTDVNFIAE